MSHDPSLYDMANALRETLGLEPLPWHEKGRGRRVHVDDEQRFYVAPLETRPARTPRRGSGA